jgi:uncharacterized protein
MATTTVATNMETVRRSYEAFAQGDVPVFLSLLDANVQWVEPEGVPLEGTYIGPDAVLKEVLIPLTSTWDGFTVTPETFLDAGDTITVLGTLKGTNKATGKKLGTPYIAVWTLRDGKVVKYQSFVNTIAFAHATSGQQMMAPEKMKTLVNRFVQVWNDGNLEMLEELFAPDYKHADGRTKTALKQNIEATRQAFPDLHVTVDDQMVDGDKVVTRWTARGTGKKIVNTGIGIDRIVNGKILESWGSSEEPGMFRQ